MEIEIERMWRFKTTVIPIMLGALGTIKRCTDKNINKIPSSHPLQDIKKMNSNKVRIIKLQKK